MKKLKIRFKLQKTRYIYWRNERLIHWLKVTTITKTTGLKPAAFGGFSTEILETEKERTGVGIGPYEFYWKYPYKKENK